MNELDWIKYLKKRTAKKNSQVIVGVGDDCGVVKVNDRFLLFTSDVCVENVHFKLKQISFKILGQRAIARAISDIAAVAGIPRFVGVSVGIPHRVGYRALKSIFEGILDICKKYKIQLIGGDTSRSSLLFIDVWMVGEARNIILRSGANVGDYIFITGRLGKLKFNQVPYIAIDRIQKLVRDFKITSMIDVSDGFSLDLYRILKASNKGAIVYKESIPVTTSFEDIFRGEDYEIIFTVSKDEKNIEKLKKKYFLVGRIKHKNFGYKLQEKNLQKEMPIRGFIHF